jgi:hypothetical protein
MGHIKYALYHFGEDMNFLQKVFGFILGLILMIFLMMLGMSTIGWILHFLGFV